MTPHDALLDDVSVYALGALPPEEAERVRAHLDDCPECREEFARLRPVVEAVAYSAEACPDLERGAVTVSPLLKQRIMKTVRADVSAARPIAADTPPAAQRTNIAAIRAVRPIVWPAYLVAAACFAIALVTSIGNLSLNAQVRQMHEEVATLRAQASVASHQRDEQLTMLADLMSTDAERYAVDHGEVVSRGTRVYIVMHAMPMPPKGMVYQAWTLRKGAKEMAPSVTFVPNHSGVLTVRLPQNGTQLAAVAMSVEPEGGSKQPTAKPEFVVKFG